MTSDIAKDYTEQMLSKQFGQILYGERSNGIRTLSSDNFTKSQSGDNNREEPISTSSYTLASENSQYSNDVDLWLRGTESAGVQNSRVAVVQRSTLSPSLTLNANSLWYIMAMILPFFSVNNVVPWRCTPSTMINRAEFLLDQLSQLCQQIRAYIRRLAEDHIARDIFATAMDIVLVVYAIGFLFLSLYQASIIG